MIFFLSNEYSVIFYLNILGIKMFLVFCLLFCICFINNFIFRLQCIIDDGTSPDKIAHIMGPPDQCQHAASIITDLLQSIRAREEGGQGVSETQLLITI